jgi:hypothetical protein
VHHLAYLDAGSGSLIVQAVIAGFAGAAVMVKLGWQRLTGKFRRRQVDEEPSLMKDRAE